MNKLQLMRVNKRLSQDIEELKAVNDNLKKSLNTMKEEPGRSMQAELLELRKRATADGFIIDEYRKSDDEKREFIGMQKKHIDSLELLIAMLITKARSKELMFAEDGSVVLNVNEITQSVGAYHVDHKQDAEANKFYIRCVEIFGNKSAE